jgi:hypothetical protein
MTYIEHLAEDCISRFQHGREGSDNIRCKHPRYQVPLYERHRCEGCPAQGCLYRHTHAQYATHTRTIRNTHAHNTQHTRAHAHTHTHTPTSGWARSLWSPRARMRPGGMCVGSTSCENIRQSYCSRPDADFDICRVPFVRTKENILTWSCVTGCSRTRQKPPRLSKGPYTCVGPE